MLLRRVSLACCAVILSAGVVACSGDDSGSRVIGTDSAQADGDGTGDSEDAGDSDAADGPDGSGGSESTEPSEPSEHEAPAEQDMTVESGFSTGMDSIGTRYTLAGARVTNPNPEVAAYDVQVLFNLIGANGDVLDTQTETVPYIGPDTSTPVAPLQIGFDLKDKPTDLEVQVVGEFSADEGPRGTFGGEGAALDITKQRVEPGEYGPELTAQASNPTDTVAEFASWSCIYLQGRKIVGGSSSAIVDPVAPGGTVQFGETLSVDIAASKVECQAVFDL